MSRAKHAKHALSTVEGAAKTKKIRSTKPEIRNKAQMTEKNNGQTKHFGLAFWISDNLILNLAQVFGFRYSNFEFCFNTPLREPSHSYSEVRNRLQPQY